MKKKDLIEFLQSTIEEDTIVSRLYRLFHIDYNYSIEELNNLITYGINNDYFIISNVANPEETYKEINWEKDNSYQEITMKNEEKYIPYLFSEDVHIPEEFKLFL
ncbi:hypothetical protein [Listeria grayi]|uniref:hypothetical protein n=1 Tax=Listeria grayi TaxID=1641 RepID=UPI001625F4B2|nr:hypothetical protein [Listeria grayi]MBC1922897.1 hypothetical protein [Listeria grayi]